MANVRLCRCGGGCWRSRCGLRCGWRWSAGTFVDVAVASVTAAGFKEIVARELAILVKLKHIAVGASGRFGGDGAEEFDFAQSRDGGHHHEP